MKVFKHFKGDKRGLGYFGEAPKAELAPMSS